MYTTIIATTYKQVFVAICTGAFATFAVAADTDKPDDYALRYTLEASGDAGLQRVSLPAAVLAATRTADRTDVRVFNASGQAVPLAIAPPRPQESAAAPSRWPIYPINATSTEQPNIGGMQLRIEERAGQRTVRVDTAPAVKSAATTTQQVGALVDTKTLSGALETLLIDADFLVGQPVPLTIAASKDLKSWRTLIEGAPVFRFGTDGAPSSMNIALNRAVVDKEYLRITWPLQQNFVLRGVQIVPASQVVAVPRVTLPLTLSATQAGAEIIIEVPFAAPIYSIDIRATAGNVLTPVRISGRSQRAEPWRSLASGVVYRISSGGAETFNPAIALNGVSVRELRIEVDRVTPGFGATPPTVSAIIDPVDVVFLATGAAPYTLAVGRVDAKRIALPLSSLIPGYVQGAELALPLAAVNTSSAVMAPPDTSALSGVREKIGAPSNRSMLLWAVLLGGVLLLGAIAWTIFRQAKSSASAAETEQT
jgi:Protein of unknown function (DUF3999)